MTVSREFVPYLDITKHAPGSYDEFKSTLLFQKGGEGYPHVVFMDADGEVLETFRPTDEATVRAAHGRAREFVDVREGLEKNPADPDLNARHLMLTLGRKPSANGFARLEAIVGGGKLSKEVLAKYREWKPGYLFAALMDRINAKAESADTDEARDALRAEFYGAAYVLHASGTVLKDVTHESYPSYWNAVGYGARKKKDAKVIAEAVRRMQAWATANADNAGIAEFVARFKRELEGGKRK